MGDRQVVSGEIDDIEQMREVVLRRLEDPRGQEQRLYN